MKKTFRSLSLVLAFALMATIIPLLRGGGFTAYAADDPFEVDSDGVLTKYTGTDSTVTIPSKVNGITVTKIGSKAFQTSTSMTKIVIPASVTSIDVDAFDYCENLTEFSVDSANSFFTTDLNGILFNKEKTKLVRCPRARTAAVTVPTTVTTIGNSSFYNCDSITTVKLQEGITTIDMWGLCSMDKLTYVTIPSTVTSIKKYAFASDTALKYMSINAKSPTIASASFNNVTISDYTYYGTSSDWSSSNWKSFDAFTNAGNYIGQHVQNGAFKGHVSPGTYVAIAPFVTSIPGGSLSSFTSTSSITLPDSLASIGSSAFDSCTSLQSLSISADNTTFKTVDGVLYSKSGQTIYRYPIAKSGASYSVASGVTTVYNSAFYKSANLTSVTLPTSVTKIDEYAFGGSQKLTSVNIPSGVKTIGKYAFNNTKLTSVNIPSSVTSVGNYAFARNNNTDGKINTFTIRAKNPATMGTDVFKETTIGTLNYGGSSSEWDSSSWKSVLSGKWSTINYRYVISGTTLTSCVDETVTNVSIPKNVTKINSSAFDGCPNITAFTVESGNTTFTAVDGVLYTDGGKTLFRFPLAKSSSKFAVPLDVTKIANSAFYKCTGVKRVTLTSNVTTLDDFAFGKATNITIITIPPSVTSIGYYAFGGMTGLKYLCINAKAPATLDDNAFMGTTGITTMAYAGTLSEWNNSKWNSQTNVKSKTKYCDTTMSDYTFKKFAGTYTEVNLCSFATYIEDSSLPSALTSVTLPDALTGYHSDALNGSNLEKISIASSNTIFKTENGILYSKDGKTLYRYPRAKSGSSFTVPSAVTTLGNSAFFFCSNLKTINLPDGLVTINEYALDNTGAELLTIPASVKTVNKYALNSINLKYLVIRSKTPTTVNAEAFSTSSSNLKELVFIGTASEWTSSKWSSVEKLNASTVARYTDADVTDRLYNYYTGSSTSVTIPSFINEVYTSAFDDAPTVTSITVNSGTSSFSSTNGVLYSYDGKTLVRYPRGKTATSFTVPSTVTTLANSAFFWCDNLKEITIPSSVTKIENFALAGPLSLTKLTIKAKNPTIASSKAIGSSKFTTVNFDGTMTEWNASSWKTVLEGKYTNLITTSTIQITQQPTNKTITEGESLTLEVKATGSGLTYQWYYKKSGQSSFSVWNNRTHAAETVTPNATWNGIQLYCVIKDSNGDTATTNTVTVTVNPAAFAITQQPTNQYIVLGKSVTVSVKATGSGLTYQWYYKKKGQSSFSVWNGRTHASETVTPNATWDGIQLYCVVKNGSGATKTSNTITVSVLSIATQPKSQTIAKGSSLTISVKATGSGLKYQWYFKKKGQSSFSVWNNRTNASETVTPNDTWDGIQLYCKVTDGKGNSVNSNAATITFGTSSAITINTQPASQSIVLGKSLTISVKATGSSLKYQWYYKKKGASSWSVWNNRTHASETVTPNNTWDGIQLYCKITDGSGNTVNSATATISVLSITTQPASQTITKGSSLTVSVKATGSGLKYQWYYKKKGASSWSVWNGRTHASETVTPNDTWDGIQLYCKVTDGAGNTLNSNAATITLK